MTLDREIYPMGQTTAFQFREGYAPFGDLKILSASHTIARHNPGKYQLDAALELRPPKIVFQSWLQSDWLPKEITQETVDELKQNGDNYAPTEIINAIHGGIVKAALNPREYNAWFAIKPKRYLHGKIGPLFIQGGLVGFEQVVGFSNGHYAVSGTPLQQMVKRRFIKDKIYAEVNNVAVDHANQNNHIGPALFYANQSSFDDDHKPTLYIAESNERLRNKVEELGYLNTGHRPRPDLIVGSTIEELRYEAISRREVVGRLINMYPWLTDAQG